MSIPPLLLVSLPRWACASTARFVNALIPALVAVLLAETGGPLTIFGRERRMTAALAMLLLLFVAGVGGWTVAAMLNTDARMLVLGLALLFAGISQFSQRVALVEKPGIVAGGMTLYRSPTPFLAFAFAAWMSAPLSAIAGAVAGVGVAVLVGTVSPTIPRAVRIGGGFVLFLAGIIAVLNGLRLV